MNASTSVSDRTEDYGSIGNEQNGSNALRIKKVPQTQKLMPAFGKAGTSHSNKDTAAKDINSAQN
jgi:hypothetical protein